MSQMSHICKVLTSKKINYEGVTDLKAEVIKVPKDMCPLDKLSEMGECIRNSWIFIHRNAYERLLRSEGAKPSGGDSVNRNKTTCIMWEATKEYPCTVIYCEIPEENGWGRINAIAASDIAYGGCPVDPKAVFFLKMAE